MFDKLKSWLGRPSMSAATDLPPQAPQKPPKKGGSSFPSIYKSTKPDRSALPRADRRLANLDLLTYRQGNDSYRIIRDYVAASPDLSNAVFSYLRVGIPEDYTVLARNPDGTVNPEATRLVQQIVARFDFFPQDGGFSGGTSLRSVSESLVKELVMYGSLAGELVLDKSLLPARIQPISVTQVEYWPGKDKKLQPYQKIGQDLLDLNFPTVCILQLDQDLLEPYSESMIQSAIKPTLFNEDLAQDLHKVVKKAIHPRVMAKINEEVFRKYGLSDAAQNDADLAATEIAALISDLENKLSGLAVDDAIVYLDSIGIEVANSGSTGLSGEYQVLQDIGNARLAAGAKTLPAVLGHGGNQNTASAEVMLFVKSVTGAVKLKLDEFYSRMFTSAVRLFGQDVYVEFKYEDIDLRPKGEMQAFKQTAQMMTLELLSLGFITDEEASIRLTGELPPATFKPLSGTMFKTGAAGGAPGNPYGGQTNSGSTLNQNLAPDTPSQGRGQNKKAEIVPLRGEA